MISRNSVRALLTGLLIVAMAVSAFAAGESEASEEASMQLRQPETVDTAQYKTEAPFTIGFDVYWLGNSWSVQFAEEFEYEASLHGDLIGEIVKTDSEGNTAKQVNNIEDMIARDVDIIVVTPLSEQALIPVFRKAEERGIPVISNAIFLQTDEARELVTSEVSVRDWEFGRVLAQWLVDELDGEGDIIALSGLAGNNTTEQRWAAATHVFDQYPGINVIAHEYADWSYPKAKSTVASLLPAHPDIDGVWSGSGNMTRGAIEAFEEAGRDLVPMPGEDNNGFLRAWYERRDSFTSLAAAKPTYIGSEACRVALQILQGQPVKDVTILEPPVITQENLENFIRMDMPDSMWVQTRLPEERLSAIFTE